MIKEAQPPECLSPPAQMYRPAVSAPRLWPVGRWSCRRAAMTSGCIAPKRRHTAGGAGCWPTPEKRRTPAEPGQRGNGEQRESDGEGYKVIETLQKKQVIESALSSILLFTWLINTEGGTLLRWSTILPHQTDYLPDRTTFREPRARKFTHE